MLVDFFGTPIPCKEKFDRKTKKIKRRLPPEETSNVDVNICSCHETSLHPIISSWKKKLIWVPLAKNP